MAVMPVLLRVTRTKEDKIMSRKWDVCWVQHTCKIGNTNILYILVFDGPT